MAPRKFYCHYCDARLPHTRDSRLNHFSGHNHIKNMKAYYRQFETAYEKHQFEVNRDKCKKFLSLSGCPYGEHCIYSHMNGEDINSLHMMAQKEKLELEYGPLPCQQLLSLAEASHQNNSNLESVLLNQIVDKKKNKIMKLLGIQK